MFWVIFEIKCDFSDKDEAKKYGCRWNSKKRVWFFAYDHFEYDECHELRNNKVFRYFQVTKVDGIVSERQKKNLMKVCKMIKDNAEFLNEYDRYNAIKREYEVYIKTNANLHRILMGLPR